MLYLYITMPLRDVCGFRTASLAFSYRKGSNFTIEPRCVEGNLAIRTSISRLKRSDANMNVNKAQFLANIRCGELKMKKTTIARNNIR